MIYQHATYISIYLWSIANRYHPRISYKSVEMIYDINRESILLKMEIIQENFFSFRDGNKSVYPATAVFSATVTTN